MSNWMKRRIQRSRARCHRTLLAHKRAAERSKSKSQATGRPMRLHAPVSLSKLEE